MLGTAALAAGLALVPSLPAGAAEATTSYARGQFLSGSLAGMSLDQVVAFAAAEARNNGSQSLQTSDDPLSATVLQSVTVESPDGVQADLGQFLDAGAVNQYAEADRNGVSLGASGAIGDDGAVGVGNTASGPAGDLDVDLDTLLDGRYDSILTDLRLSLDAVSAQARANLAVASGDYRIEGATLTFTSPAIADLTGKVASSLGVVDGQLLDLSSDDGAIALAVGRVLDPVLSAVGSSANVDVTISSDLDAAVQSLLTSAYGNGAVHFNLQTGEVTVDLEALLGGDLNNLDPGTELLSADVLGPVLDGITRTVSTLADQIVDRVRAALHDATVEVHADLDLLSPQGSTESTVCHDIEVPVIGDILGTGGLLGGLLGGSTTQGIVGYTTQTLCDVVETVLPDLRSTVNVDVVGTVDQLLDGTAARADATVSLLDGTVQSSVNVDALIEGIGTGLLDGLFDSDGTVNDLADALDVNLVDPALSGLLGDTGVGAAITSLVSVKANVQETDGGMFTQTAVRIAALDGQLATLSVASATVGPNVTVVVPPDCTTNCSPGGDPDPCVSNCGPGGGDTPAGTSGGGNLAMTGLGIATLVAIVLALLAIGAYLARQGYRQNHPALADSGPDE